MEMIWWTGLVPWELEFPFPGSLISIFLPLRKSSRQPQKSDSLERRLRLLGEIDILLPNNQRQHRTLHIQKDELPYALC